MKLSPKRCELMASGMSRRLLAEGLIAGVTRAVLSTHLAQSLIEDLSVEDRLNDEVRQLLAPYADQIRQQGVDYHEAFKKAKAKLVRDRKLVL